MIDDRSERETELVRRLRCAEDHLRDIITMIKHDADWRSIVYQILAVQGTLREIEGLIVKHHLAACLRELLSNAGVEPAVPRRYREEIISIYQLLGK
jgi:DNA-binding FrmR family transcriptional regulator